MAKVTAMAKAPKAKIGASRNRPRQSDLKRNPGVSAKSASPSKENTAKAGNSNRGGISKAIATGIPKKIAAHSQNAQTRDPPPPAS